MKHWCAGVVVATLLVIPLAIPLAAFAQAPKPATGSLTIAFAAEATTLDIRIRNGMKFHNGDPLTAANFAFSYNRVRGRKSAPSTASAFPSRRVRRLRWSANPAAARPRSPRWCSC
jgi:ABC-type transport system substrate-binding protein